MPVAMHIVLHLVLCTGARHGAAPVNAIHVALVNRIGNAAVDRTIAIPGDNPFDTIVDFDAPRGLFLLRVNQAKSACGAQQFVLLSPEANRSIPMTLLPRGLQNAPRVPTLFNGATPLGFDYAEPTVVLVSGSVGCDKPIGEILPVESVTENDPDGYYVAIFTYTSVDALPPKIALRLTDNGGGYHYVRMNIPFSKPGQLWPNSATFDVDTGLIAEVLEKPEDTYLCLKLLRGSVSG